MRKRKITRVSLLCQFFKKRYTQTFDVGREFLLSLELVLNRFRDCISGIIIRFVLVKNFANVNYLSFECVGLEAP